MPSEELQCHVCIGDDRASLLPDCLADDAGALDVARLSFAHSEDVGDALDAVHVTRCVVCWLAAAIEGVLYSLVDYLCELCYGEVDDASVLVHIVLNLFVLVTREGLEPPSSSSRVIDVAVAVEGLFLLSYQVMCGEDRLLSSPDDYERCQVPRITAVVDWRVILSLRPGTRQDPLKNSSGLLVPSVQIIAALCSLLSQGGGQGPACQTNLYTVLKTPACSPVHVYLVSFVVAVVADFSGSVASSAAGL